MSLIDQTKGFLKVLGAEVYERENNLLIAERPGLAGETERTCVWVLTQQARQGRNQLALEDEYFRRFKGIASKYPGARLHLLLETMEGFSTDFRTEASRRYRVRIQVPVQFFDLPFAWEEGRSVPSATLDLVKEAERYGRNRVPQSYTQDDTDQSGRDLVTDLFAEINSSLRKPESRLWFVVAPAGHGKSVCFSALFGNLHRQFIERKRAQSLYPRPLPMLAAHLRESAGPNVMGLVDAFMRTEFAVPATREFFNWMIDNRLGLLMFDGLDELITRGPGFLDYLEDRITAPNSSPLILISVRDSLFQSSEELANFVDYYRPIINVYTIKPWDRPARRVHAWLHLEGRLPRNGDQDTPTVAHFLRACESNQALQRLASTPFYADLLVRTVADQGSAAPPDEVGLIDVAIESMCRREYEKGTLKEDILPLGSFREWLEELAALSQEASGLSVDDLHELADLATIFVARELGEDERRELVKQITMAPFLTQSGTSGRLQLTHEILAEFLAGRRFAAEFTHSPTRFASRLSQRPWPFDSMLFPVLAQALVNDLDRLSVVPTAEPLSQEGLRNLVQLIALIPGGDAALRTGRLSLDGAHLFGVRFVSLNLEAVSFRSCDLSNTVFDKCKLRGAHFEGAVLRNTAFLDIPEQDLVGATFGECEHFESIVVGERKRVEDPRAFEEWLEATTGRREPIVGPCPTARQVLFLFRKFIQVDGQPRRDSLDRRGVLRGRQEPGAPSTGDCLDAAIDFGYFQTRDFSQVRRAAGPGYGEMVTFVKSQSLTPGLRSLIDSLCRIPGCRHLPGAAGSP